MNKILLGLLLGRCSAPSTALPHGSPRRSATRWPGSSSARRSRTHRRRCSRNFARKVNSVRSAFCSGSGSDSSSLPGGLPAARLYFEIILPGSIVGMIVGYATQRYGLTPGRPLAKKHSANF